MELERVRAGGIGDKTGNELVCVGLHLLWAKHIKNSLYYLPHVVHMFAFFLVVKFY